MTAVIHSDDPFLKVTTGFWMQPLHLVGAGGCFHKIRSTAREITNILFAGERKKDVVGGHQLQMRRHLPVLCSGREKAKERFQLFRPKVVHISRRKLADSSALESRGQVRATGRDFPCLFSYRGWSVRLAR